MYQINIASDLFYDVQRRAVESGFANVDDYVAEVLSRDLRDGTPDLDHYFTPERLALIEKSAAKVDAGQFLTSIQMDEELLQRREAWLRQHPGAK